MRTWLTGIVGWLSLFGMAHGQPATVTLQSPQPYQVLQRTGYDPIGASKRELGHIADGFADVPIRGTTTIDTSEGTWEYRTLLLKGGMGATRDWTPILQREGGSALLGEARIPAGGWFRLEVRCRKGTTILAQGDVASVGVGEVFLVAGQSYATNCNDKRLLVTDPALRVSAYDTAKKTWNVAHDPQPAPDNSDGGSIWPPLGDALVKELRVPVAFVNVAYGGTSSVQWQPKGTLHPRLVQAGQTLGRFRAVLWQQGESDVIAKTPTADYVTNIQTIRTTATTAWHHEIPWLLAYSTHHPTVYNDAAGETRIRAGTTALTRLPGFAPGPDTDTLQGENRGPQQSRRHFSAVGQQRAADLWFATLKQHLQTPRPVRESLVDLHLLEPAWASTVVHRESSVLLQLKEGDHSTARLAYPAARVLTIDSADGVKRLPSNAWQLGADGQTITFTETAGIERIAATALFPPKDSPNSYRHRLDHPEQNLLYRPGRWFHDHNVEITYVRRGEVAKAAPIAGTLPKTLARLKASQPLTVGVSGDSISTGLDASASAKAFPYQPGYPDLVCAQLEALYNVPITLKNRAISGWSVANGVNDLDKLLAEKPHLIVIAYGMNDVGRRDPAWFRKQTKTMLERIKATDANIEILLVAPMLGHAEWVHTPRAMFGKYRDELKALTGPGVALADVTAVWEAQLKHKHDLDLTGNGLNHPNDYGHRLYAQTLLQSLKSD